LSRLRDALAIAATAADVRRQWCDARAKGTRCGDRDVRAG
jgi:hypothetical protein